MKKSYFYKRRSFYDRQSFIYGTTFIFVVTGFHTTLKAFQWHNRNLKVHMIQTESCWPLHFCNWNQHRGLVSTPCCSSTNGVILRPLQKMRPDGHLPNALISACSCKKVFIERKHGFNAVTEENEMRTISLDDCCDSQQLYDYLTDWDTEASMSEWKDIICQS